MICIVSVQCFPPFFWSDSYKITELSTKSLFKLEKQSKVSLTALTVGKTHYMYSYCHAL